jgi:NodT family efflux transporter outer membrane factor (OMF) lipoprotein
VLVGHAPAEWLAPDFDFSKLKLPATLPLSLPSELVRQRPDILASEAQLHAATAEVGIASANLYPHVTLSGSLGEQALTLGTLFASGNGAYSLTSGLTQPLFDGGTLRATRRADVDAMNARLADYQHTVLESLRQVADVLGRIDHDAELLAAEARAVDAAQASLNLARESYQAGNSGILQVLDAERALQRSRLEYVRVAGQRLNDSARLFLALGGTAP